jgi:hypothetical protein
MEAWWGEIKKRLASVNLTLALLLGFFAVYRGIDPCESLFMALTGVGIADINVNEQMPVVDGVGPPMPGQTVIQLADGRKITILENGAVMVESETE